MIIIKNKSRKIVLSIFILVSNFSAFILTLVLENNFSYSFEKDIIY